MAALMVEHSAGLSDDWLVDLRVALRAEMTAGRLVEAKAATKAGSTVANSVV